MTTDLSGGLSDELEYVFTEQPDDPEMRESVNAWIWNDAGEVGFPRIAVEAVADQWDTHDVQLTIALTNGRVLTMFEAGPVHKPRGADGRATILGAGPLSFEVLAPFGGLRLVLHGEATVNTVDAQIQGVLLGQAGRATVDLEVELRPVAPPWLNGALLPQAKKVLDTQEEGDLMGHPWRFEQLCSARGVLVVDGKRYDIKGGANRIRRQSIRREAKLRGHVWHAATFADGRGFGYIVYPDRGDGKPTYNEGYVYYGEGPLIPARVVEAPWLDRLVPSGEKVTCVLESERGTVRIDGQTVLSTFIVMPPEIGGGLQLSQSIVRYTWDGQPGNGMLERSTTAQAIDDPSRS
jgi:hypothetical protein